MSMRIISQLGIKFLPEISSASFLAPATSSNLQFIRHRQTKHWNPKWKKLRGMKVFKVDLPKYNERSEDFTEEEIRTKYKEKGLLPHRPWMERQFFISSTGGIFEPYVPPEGDGKVSPISAQGAKQRLQFLEKKTKTMMAIRKIRSFDEDFDTPEFCKHAEKIYLQSHDCMVNKDRLAIRDLITERAYPEVMHNITDKTIRWRFLQNVELPRVVHARCTDVVTKENIFAQVTVRFHTQQQLEVYDRFGRLMHGSEIIAKDVLEYVVFEKHVANEYGRWRIHDKIIPDWMPPVEPSPGTYLKAPEVPVIEDKTEGANKVVLPITTTTPLPTTS